VNALDVVIVVAAVVFAFSGFRNGAVIGAFSIVGFFGGAVLGAHLAEPLGRSVAHGKAQVPVAIVSVLLISTLGQLSMVWVGGHVRRVLVTGRGHAVDSSVGSALGVASVLLVAWMIAVPLASSPYPSLASQASHSSIVRSVNGVMPASVRSLYSSLRSFLDQSGFPPMFGDLPSTPIYSVAAPDPHLPAAVAAQVARAHRSTFKIYGEAPECGRGIEGSGFVYVPHYVLTNAHVVAGARQVTVQVSRNDYLPATVVLFDPERDVAVLHVPALDAPALRFDSTRASRGDPAVVLGYPEDGPFTVRAARIRSDLTVTGNDIYGRNNVHRDIYSLRAIVRSGNSGGPLLGYDGSVLGVVFATALDSSDTGYVLTNREVASDAAAGSSAVAPVSTQSCTA
jgi:S1-C subfamily serine protease